MGHVLEELAALRELQKEAVSSRDGKWLLRLYAWSSDLPEVRNFAAKELQSLEEKWRLNPCDTEAAPKERWRAWPRSPKLWLASFLASHSTSSKTSGRGTSSGEVSGKSPTPSRSPKPSFS
ncbi:unnamed protein product [Effrenium voratum]|uniref:Uncharacterized protein n=1 Tax=Effrenium voratum TaxID=2562239 RepID=A0AA36NFC2_9DINO|nr:unnamed protein product [Effrenium voratum]